MKGLVFSSRFAYYLAFLLGQGAVFPQEHSSVQTRRECIGENGNEWVSVRESACVSDSECVVSDAREAISFGVDLDIGLGPEDSAMRLEGTNALFLLRAKVNRYDSSSQPCLRPVDDGSKIRWERASGISAYDPVTSSVVNGEGLTVVRMPAIHGNKTKLDGRICKLLVDGRQIPWGPPAPEAENLPYRDYQEAGPKCVFCRVQRLVQVPAKGQNLEDLFLSRISLAETLGVEIAGNNVTLQRVDGTGIVLVKDAPTGQVVAGPENCGLIDITHFIADGDLKLDPEGVGVGTADYLLKYRSTGVAALVVIQMVMAYGSPTGSGGGRGGDSGVEDFGRDGWDGVRGDAPVVEILPPQIAEFFPGMTLQLGKRVIPANATVTWSAVGGVDVDNTGKVTAWNTGTATVTLTASFTEASGVTQELNDSLCVSVFEPIVQLLPPAGPLYEGQVCSIIAEAYPGTIGQFENWGFSEATTFASIGPGDSMNVQFQRDGRTWLKATGKLQLNQLPSMETGYISPQVTYRVAYPPEPSKDYKLEPAIK